MKKEIKYQLLLFPVVFALWYLFYPEHLGAIEAYSFYVDTPDYMSAKGSSLSGISELAGNFLAQFYRWREWGACIQAVLFLFVLFGFDLLLYRLRLHRYLWIATIPAAIFLLFQLRWELHLAPAVTTLFVLYVIIAIFWLALPRRSDPTFPPLSAKRRGVIIALYAGIIVITATLFVTDKKAKEREVRYAVENAAFTADWNRVLTLLSPEEAMRDPLLLRYTLLALSEKEMLADQLFKLHALPPDCFYFYRTSDPATQYFNSLFYAGLGLYNESIHQLFEATTATPNGMSFRCMRALIDWNLKTGNAPLVEKYLTIINRSTCHKGWSRKREILLTALKEKPVNTPDRSNRDLFIGAYGFIPEMGRLVEEDPRNKKKTDYLLCALLLEGDITRFREVLEHSIYRSSSLPMPKIYQQKQAPSNLPR